jgi:hypothetical protein
VLCDVRCEMSLDLLCNGRERYRATKNFHEIQHNSHLM